MTGWSCCKHKQPISSTTCPPRHRRAQVRHGLCTTKSHAEPRSRSGCSCLQRTGLAVLDPRTRAGTACPVQRHLKVTAESTATSRGAGPLRGAIVTQESRNSASRTCNERSLAPSQTRRRATLDTLEDYDKFTTNLAVDAVTTKKRQLALLHTGLARRWESSHPAAEDGGRTRCRRSGARATVGGKGTKQEKQQAWNTDRTALMGKHPPKTRQAIRAGLELGFYLSYSGKKVSNTLQKLGACYTIPGVD